MRITTVALFTSLALVGCRSGDQNTIDGNGSGGSDGSGSGTGTKIQDIQAAAMPVGTPVTLKGVVVTAVDLRSAQSTNGSFWVEEPEGGELSGIHVFHGTVSDVAALVPGDIVDISGGVKAEFALTSDTSGNTVTELEPPSKTAALTITKTGTGALPTPVAVDALMIGQLSTQAECRAAATTCATNVEWEKYEGVLIKVTSTGGGLTVFGTPKMVGSDATVLGFNTNGQFDVESEIAAFPTIASGDCLASVTGVLDYFFNYNLLPTQTSDVATGGAGCPAREQAAGSAIGLCGDTTDNDGNGFSDCGDLSCEVGSNAWLDPSNCSAGATTCGCSANEPVATGASKLNPASGTALTGPAILNSEIVTAVGGSGFWISDSATAAANKGVFVFQSATPTVTVGNTVSVQGIAGPFNLSKAAGAVALNELSNATVIGTPTGNTAVTPLSGQTAATLSGITSGAPFAGVLVTLDNIKVTVAPTMANHFQMTVVDKNGTTFTLDDGAFGSYSGATTAVGTCYSTVTGVMDMQTCATGSGTTCTQLRTLNPRSKADMTSGGNGC